LETKFSEQRKEERGMTKNSKIDNDEKEINLDKEQTSGSKKKIFIFLATILVLSLITSGLTTNFFGRIGTAFRNEGKFNIGGESNNEKEIVKNQELRFDKEVLNVSLSSSSGKISYSRNKILPLEYTCETDDATIATCYVADGYVVVYPKGVGSTVVTLNAETSGKIYVSKATVNVTDVDRYIELPIKEGTVNLKYGNKKTISYNLVRLNGDVKATSSNDSVAKVNVKNKVVEVTALKEGKVDIKISVSYNGETYENVYNLKVVNESNKASNDAVVKRKSKVSTLSNLVISNGELKFDSNITNYSVLVDKDVKNIGIDFETTNSKAKVIATVDGLATTSLKNIPLSDSAKEVIITVISEDGNSKTIYTVAINRTISKEENIISEIKINNEVLKADMPMIYSKKVAADVNSIDLSLDLKEEASVEYFVDNKSIGSHTSLREFELKSGKNTIKVVISTKKGISFIYFISIEKEAPSKNANLNLDTFEVLDDGYTLEQINENDDKNYTVKNLVNSKKEISINAVCEDPNCTGITSTITYDDGTTVDLDDLNNIPLKEGNNKIAITVTAEDGETTNTYYVDIYRPIRTITFENAKEKVEVEKDYTDILYTVKDKNEDGTFTDNVELSEEEIKELKAFLKINNDDVKIDVYQGYVRVTPVNPKELVDVKTELIISNGDGKEATVEVEFGIGDYSLSSGNSFTMNTSSKNNTRSIIVSSTLVDSTENNLKITSSDDKKTLTICSNDEVYCVELSVDSANDAGDITLEYGKDSTLEIGSEDLPITLIADGKGKSVINVKGTVYGKEISKKLEIEIDVIRNYIVTILANDPSLPEDKQYGKFNKIMKSDEQEISSIDGVIDLSTYDEPYKIDENCDYYKFKEFTDGTNIYNRDDKKLIEGSKLSGDITVYAVYEDTPTEEELPETNSLWLSQVDLFENKEYEVKYGKPKVIYPGAEGSYEMKFTADEKLKITGLTLKENTICVEGGCLNMGYIVHYNEIRYKTPVDGKDYERIEKDYVGKKADKNYWILNQNYGIMNEVSYLGSDGQKAILDNVNRADISFGDGISMNPGDEISITIFWKWVEIDEESDKVDTKIGEYSAENAGTINDKYSLAVGIIYDAEEDSCTTTD